MEERHCYVPCGKEMLSSHGEKADIQLRNNCDTGTENLHPPAKNPRLCPFLAPSETRVGNNQAIYISNSQENYADTFVPT